MIALRLFSSLACQISSTRQKDKRMESLIKATSALMTQNATLLTQELQILMKEVEKLREETKSITCNCCDPCCPFSVKNYENNEEGRNAKFEKEGESPDFGFSSMETIHQGKCMIKKQSSLPSNPKSHLSTSLTNIPRGLHKRADGTIVETDYPGFCCSSRKSKKKKRPMGSSSMVHLNHLDVCNLTLPLDDCQVDQDGAISTNIKYKFKREAPERKKVRSPHSATSHKLSISFSKDISSPSCT